MGEEEKKWGKKEAWEDVWTERKLAQTKKDLFDSVLTNKNPSYVRSGNVFGTPRTEHVYPTFCVDPFFKEVNINYFSVAIFIFRPSTKSNPRLGRHVLGALKTCFTTTIRRAEFRHW